jgi:hypothetical protein
MSEIGEAKQKMIAEIAIAKDSLNKALAMCISIEDNTVNGASLANECNTFVREAHEHTSRAVANSVLLQMRTAKTDHLTIVQKA